MSKQNFLVTDIETSPMEAYIWELGEQVVSLAQVKREWSIIAWSAKWLEAPDSSIVYYDLRNKPIQKDKCILQPLWKLLNQADVVITQNGKKFDSKKINARFMLNNMPPPKPYLHFDTYLLVKNVADLTSNKLEYLTDKFCAKHKKTTHGKFPGLTLWTECEKNNIEAWKEMEKYNKKDVLSTEELYLNLRAWAPESMPKVHVLTDDSAKCGHCGHIGPMREGRPLIKKSGVYTQNSCLSCGSWQSLKQKKVKQYD